MATYNAVFHVYTDHIRETTRQQQVELPDMKAVCHFLLSIDAESFHPRFRDSSRTSIKGPVVVYHNSDVIAFLALNDENSQLGRKTEVVNNLLLSFKETVYDIAEQTGIRLNKFGFPSSETNSMLLAEFDKQQQCFIYAPGYLIARAESQVVNTASDSENATLYSEVWLSDKGKKCSNFYLPSMDDAIKKMMEQNISFFDPLASGWPAVEKRDEFLQAVRIYNGDLEEERAELFYIDIPEFLKGETSVPYPGIYFAYQDATFTENVLRATGKDIRELAHYNAAETMQLVGDVTFDKKLHIESDNVWSYRKVQPPKKQTDSEYSLANPYHVVINGKFSSKSMSYLFDHHHFFYNPAAALDCLLKQNMPSLITSVNRLTHNCYQLNNVSIWRNDRCLLRTAVSLSDGISFELPSRNEPALLGLLRGCGLHQKDKLSVGSLRDDGRGITFTSEYRALSHHIASEAAKMPSVLNSHKIAAPAPVLGPELPYCVLVGSRTEPIGYFLVKDISFADAYSRLQNWDEKDFTNIKGIEGGFRVSVTDKEGEPLITRLSIRDSDLVPAGVYTMIFSDKITPEVLSCIKGDLKIISTQGEQFLCRSMDGASERLERKPSPLSPSELLPATRSRGI